MLGLDVHGHAAAAGFDHARGAARRIAKRRFSGLLVYECDARRVETAAVGELALVDGGNHVALTHRSDFGYHPGARPRTQVLEDGDVGFAGGVFITATVGRSRCSDGFDFAPTRSIGEVDPRRAERALRAVFVNERDAIDHDPSAESGGIDGEMRESGGALEIPPNDIARRGALDRPVFGARRD